MRQLVQHPFPGVHFLLVAETKSAFDPLLHDLKIEKSIEFTYEIVSPTRLREGWAGTHRVDMVLWTDVESTEGLRDKFPHALIRRWLPDQAGSLVLDILRLSNESLRRAWREEFDRRRELERLRRQVTPFDPRTGWHSHAHIVDRCQEEIVRAAHLGMPIALVVVEITNLEPSMPAHETDQESSLVTSLAQRLRPICRQGDILGHYGPSSILILLPGTDRAGAERFSGRLAQALLPPLEVDEIERVLEWSAALVAREIGSPVTPTELLNQLERRVEQARRLGKRGFVLA